MIPQNTTKITKEMRMQLEIEQKQIEKELVTYYDWINQSHILFKIMLHKINMKWKNYSEKIKFKQNRNFYFFLTGYMAVTTRRI